MLNPSETRCALAAFDPPRLRRLRRRQDRNPADDARADRRPLRLGLLRHRAPGDLRHGGGGDLRLPMGGENPGQRLVDRGGDGVAVVEQRLGEVDEHRRPDLCEPRSVEKRRTGPPVLDELLDRRERVGVVAALGSRRLSAGSSSATMRRACTNATFSTARNRPFRPPPSSLTPSCVPVSAIVAAARIWL